MIVLFLIFCLIICYVFYFLNTSIRRAQRSYVTANQAPIYVRGVFVGKPVFGVGENFRFWLKRLKFVWEMYIWI